MEGEAAQAKLVQCIQDSLAHFLLPNAVFLSERLYAMSKNDYNLNVLATCYYRSGKPQKSYSLLKPHLVTSENRYLFALCCYDLKKYQEAESALLSSSNDLYAANVENLVPNGAAGLLLLGQLYQRRSQKARAIYALQRSLQLNPFLFQAFTLLCQLGYDDDPREFFGDVKEKGDKIGKDESKLKKPVPSMIQFGDLSNSRTICSTPLLTPMVMGGVVHHVPSPASNVTPFLSTLSKSTPFSITPNKSISFTPIKPPMAYNEQSKVCTPLNNPQRVASRESNRKTKRKAQAVLFPEETPVEISEPVLPKETNQKILQTPHKGDWTPMESMQREDDEGFLVPSIFPKEIPELTVISDDTLTEGSTMLLELLCILGRGYQHICQYRCRDTLSTFQELPESQLETGWVLNLMGKAYLELADYAAGKRYFEKVLRMEPYRTEGMELYSTILWYMRQQIELSYLAHELVEFDRLSPESWCVVGNCFSLQNEHVTALKIFKRAIQLDSSFVYAYTLSGHEYLAIDDLEKAAVCYRNAIQVDERHYNAWYGLGMIYFRQELLELAEYHFKKAIQIHRENSVLHYHLGMVYFSQSRYEEALKRAEQAITLCNTNNMAIFLKARCLYFLGNLEQSLEFLVMLNERAPKQAKIYYAMGRLYKMLGHIEDAVKALSIAMDLDTQNSNIIKVALERVDKEEKSVSVEDIFDLS